MRIKYIFVLIFVILTGLFSQNEDPNDFFRSDYIDDSVGSTDILSKGPVGDRVVTVIFAKFPDKYFEVDIDWRTNPDLMFPTMFSIPKLENPNEIESIEEYVQKNGSLSMYDYFFAAIPEYYSEMTNGKLNVTVNFEKNPDRSDGLWVLPNDFDDYSYMSTVVSGIDIVIDDYYYTTTGETGYMQRLKLNSTVCYNFQTVEIGKSGYTNSDAPCVSQHNENFADLLAINIHELGHSMLYLKDTGNDYEYSYMPEYDAEINGSFAGRSNTTDGPFNMMWHNDFQPSPYARYGIFSFATNDMIRLGYIENADVELIEEKISGNRTDVRIKAVSLAETGDMTAIKIPITIDSKAGDSYRPYSGSGVEAQHFLVEYRNSQMYDEISGLDHQGQSKGILITHIINSDSYMPTMDIEIATPYPRYWSNEIDLFRDPDSSITKDGIPYLNTNGDYYNGKKDVDWLDDLNRNPYSPDHGMGPYWKAENALKARSLPTDFFSATAPERNKFTPTTYPSTASWKLQDTHIGVYMNGEDGSYADVTVYRNYWSKPIITGSVKTISNEGYIGENLIVETGAELILDENSVISIIPNTNMVVQYGSFLKLAEGAKLIVDHSNLTIEDGAIIELAGGAEIVVKGDGKLYATGTIFLNVGNTGNWKGITAETGSSVTLANCEIKSAETGLTATAANVTVTFTSFTDCVNGINLVNCNDLNSSSFNLFGNNFRGLNTGTGIYLTISDGNLRSNTIENFSEGIRFVLSSSIVTKNNIWNNSKYGIVSSGSNAIPFLGNYEKAPGLNNNIINNGPVTPPNISPFPYAQIGIIPIGNVYLKDGMNNIFSGSTDAVPDVPCISISGISPVPEDQYVLIDATGNYWGALEDLVTDDFFSLRYPYALIYKPCSDVPFILGETYSSNESPDTETIILSNAVLLEDKENYTASIKQYEHVIDRYEDTPEYYVALARLPYVYLKAGIDTESLIRTYDDGIESDKVSNKKFLKEMKIATHIKGKKYDTAIALAEEMKSEAQCEEEILLAEIDIAVCNIMKESEGKGGNKNDATGALNELMSKLYGDDDKSEPASITENILPETSELFQNYPNPFNPVTQIKFALSKTAEIKLNVYNVSGQKVSELANGSRQAGIHTVDFDGSRLNSGIYYYTLEVDGKTFTQKMILMK